MAVLAGGKGALLLTVAVVAMLVLLLVELGEALRPGSLGS